MHDHLCDPCLQVIDRFMHVVKAWRNSKVACDDEPSWTDPNHPNDYTLSHHGNLLKLQKSAHSGCRLCNLLSILDKTTASPDCPQLEANTARAYNLKILPVPELNDQLGYLDLATFATSETYDVRVCIWNARTSSYDSSSYAQSTGSSQVLQVAKRWLTDCLDGHEKCNSLVTPPHHRPTRLVRLRSIGDRVTSISLFCYAAGQDRPVDYLTLSHCWGQGNFVQLNTANLTAFHEDIPMDLLPKTFADAIYITHFLGFQYVWIDSLCIIQDSLEDWTLESKSMGKIYQHAICTLAAVGADNSNDGCFYQRLYLKEHLSDNFWLPVYDLFAHKQQGRSYDSGCPASLHSRAWVMQEQCLSVRAINFGRHEISWNCVSTNISEPRASTSSLVGQSTLPHEFYASLAQPTGKGSNSQVSHNLQNLEFWWKIVQQYSGRDLTVATDKWPAFQGLAFEVARAWKQSLFYGLWEHDILHELLWSISIKPLHPKLEVGAPSWSWLSMSSAVVSWNLRFEVATVEHASVQASVAHISPDVDTAHFSEPRAPELHVTGRLASLVTYAFEWVNIPWRYRFCLIKRRRHLKRITRRKAAEHIVQQSAIATTWVPDLAFDASWNTFALHLATYIREDGSGILTGLVVMPIATSRTTFTRLGFFTYQSDDVKTLRDSTFGLDMSITLK
ncbi:hypothetical protein [Plenodomus lingam JN3]|uniref:Heterokaryon incompatibility domain-containing protein n=1 Tax=Leptosphaeria maculans (strain JN3 / isolate v23.1.3 / race Av1-4-5-6-7-8) TaxID=985895 RepID=M1Z7N4_LEPMJ|nr:hypothetical protein [Plenodomus lingam JN3]